jgi:hypothetical protein
MTKVLKDHGQEANHGQEEHVQIQDARPNYGSVSASLTLSFWIEKWQQSSAAQDDELVQSVRADTWLERYR